MLFPPMFSASTLRLSFSYNKMLSKPTNTLICIRTMKTLFGKHNVEVFFQFIASNLPVKRKVKGKSIKLSEAFTGEPVYLF